jgi:hypothetical protein
MDSVRILRGRKPKHLRVVAAELCRTFIADLEGSCHDTLRIRHHQCSGLEQAHAFLILQRAQVGHGLEVAVEGRDAHRRPLGQALDAYGLGEVLADPLYREVDTGHCAVGRRDLSQHPAKGALKHAENDLALVHRGQGCDGIGVTHQPQHSNPGVHEISGHRCDRKAGRVIETTGRFGQVGEQRG